MNTIFTKASGPREFSIEGKSLHIYDPATKTDKEIPVGSRIGAVVPVQDGGVLVTLQNGIQKLDTKTGKLSFIKEK